MMMVLIIASYCCCELRLLALCIQRKSLCCELLFWKDSRSAPETALLRLKTLEQRYNLLITVVSAYSLLTSAKLNLGVKV